MVMPNTGVCRSDYPTSILSGTDNTRPVVSYIIATKVFGVPCSTNDGTVVVYPTAEKLEIRRNFILLNGDAKEPLDFIDTYKQMVFRVRVHGADDDAWIKANPKTSVLEQAGLFAQTVSLVTKLSQVHLLC